MYLGMNDKKKEKLFKLITIIIGAFIFCFGINIFIVPVGLYNGGVVGISQIIRTVIGNFIDIPKDIDISGIINLMFNIPLLIMAYNSISKKFFVKTVISVICQTVFFTLIKIPEQAIISDSLTACLIGGIISGVGIGITLRAGGSGGGIDILGVYFAQKFSSFSVGKLGIIINIFVYAICALLFNLPTAIYSIIYTTVYSLMIDKTHYQNINTTAMIFTKQKSIDKRIMKEMHRGVTYWQGKGAYTNEDSLILVTVISKYEISQLKRIVKEIDSKAFIIFNDGMDVTGNFEKRL